MSALAYLHTHGLNAEPLPDGKLSISPVTNITPDIRAWIRDHKEELLTLLTPATDEHGPVGPCRCGCCSWYQTPGATDWRCRECRPVKLGDGYANVIVTK